jgi:hypothetical protein
MRWSRLIEAGDAPWSSGPAATPFGTMQSRSKFQLNRWVPWAPLLGGALMLWAPRVWLVLCPLLLAILVARDPGCFLSRTASLRLAVALIALLCALAWLWFAVVAVLVVSALR